MNLSLKGLITLGIVSELLLFLVCYVMQPNLEETFRYAARYSGRLSLIVFLITFYLFAFGHPKSIKQNTRLRNWLFLFAVLHVIHFGFLATNVFLNDIPIVPVKLLGGALAYLMIVVAPLVLHKTNLSAQLVYFYYVSLVMIITYIARVKGDFKGAEPFWFHYLALGTLLLSSIVFAGILFMSNKKRITD